jgi:hypothetical protein
LKQLELGDFNERTRGYTLCAAQTNLEHQRLIYSMRCYLAIAAMNFFHIPVMSANDFIDLKNSFVDKANFIEDSKNFIELSNTDDRFWLLMRTTSDKNNSEKFFKKIMSEVLSRYHIPKEERDEITKIVIQKCYFTVL